MIVRPTGSKVHRAWKCPASIVLPQVREVDVENPPAERGTRVHRYLEIVRQVGPDAALAEVCPTPNDPLTPMIQAIPWENMPPVAVEVAFAWNWRTRTARELGRGIARRYDLLPADVEPIDWASEIPCTIDLVGVGGPAGKRRAYVGDYKTGHSRLPAPDRFGQLLLAALCARVVYETIDVVVELLRIYPDGHHETIRRIVDGWDLMAFADEIEEAMLTAERAEDELAAGGQLDVTEGPHCDYCPAFTRCPAKIALVRAMPEAIASMPAPGQVTRAAAAAIWMRKEAFEAVLNRIGQEVINMVAADPGHPLELPDGRVIGPVETTREKIDGRIAAEVLERRYGRDTRDEFVEPHVTKDALRLAASKHKEPAEKLTNKAGTGAFDRLLAEIHQRQGGRETKTTVNIRPHTPRRGGKRKLPEGDPP